MIVEKFRNLIFESNCYSIIQRTIRNVIVVDPGDHYLTDLLNYLLINDLTVEYVIFTHEHYDHIAGGKLLKQKFNCKFIGSKECADAIINPKRNLSIFYENVPYESPIIDFTIEELNYQLNWNSTVIRFLATPGHSKGSISFLINNNIFTGDTLIKDIKTVTSLPGGNPYLLEKSVELIGQNCDEYTMVYPGHKDIFRYVKERI